MPAGQKMTEDEDVRQPAEGPKVAMFWGRRWSIRPEMLCKDENSFPAGNSSKVIPGENASSVEYVYAFLAMA